MFKAVLYTFWVPTRGELGAPLRVLPGFLMKYSWTPLIRIPKNPEMENGSS